MSNPILPSHHPRSFVALLLGYGVWGVFWGIWGALLPAVKLEAHASDAILGATLLFVAVGALPAMLFMGRLIDRFGSRVLIVSFFLFAGAVSLLAFVHSPLLLAIVLLLIGASSGALDVCLNSASASLEKVTNKKLFNKLTAAFPIAVVFASPLAGFARELHVHLTTIFLTVSIIIIFVALLNVSAHTHLSKTHQQKETESVTSARSITKLLILLGVIAAGIHIVEVAIEQWSAIFIEHGLQGTPAMASFGPAVYMGMLFVGRFAAQLYEHRCTERQILFIVGLSAALGTATAAVATSPLIALLGFAIAGLGMASGIPAVFSLTGRSVSDSKRGQAISFVTAIAYVGYLISPPIMGGLATLITLKFSWLALSSFAFIAALSLFLFSKRFVTSTKVAR